MVVHLVARTGDQNPVLVEVDRILEEQRVAAQLVGLRAVAVTHAGAFDFAAIHRVQVTEGAQAALADQVGAVDLAVFVIQAEQQVMLHPRQLHLALKTNGGETVAAERAVGTVHAPGQGAAGSVDGGHPHLAGVVGFAVVAETEVSFPVVRKLMVDFQAVEVRAPLHVIERLVQAPRAGDIQRVVGARIDGRATVERIEKFTVLVGQQHLGVFAVPGQRWRHQRFAVGAEVAPVVFIFMVEHQAVGEVAVAQRAGAVQAAAAAALAAAISRAAQVQGVVALQLRPLADHVDHPARVLDTVQQ
ncbi:hypothetical protein D3C79_718980 [compost metagenome]